MKRHARRTLPHWWLGIATLLSLALLAGCGGATDSAGTNLGAGPLLAFIGGDGNLWLAKGDGSQAHAVTVTPCPATQSCYGPPAWSPDGTSVALFGPDGATPTNKDIFVYNRQGLLQQTIHPVSPLAFGRILWSSDGKQVAYVGNPDETGTSGSKVPRYALVLFVVSSGAKAGAIILPSPTNVQCSSNARGGSLGSLVERSVYGSTGQGLRDTLAWTTNGQTVLINGINADSCGPQVQVVDRGGSSKVLAAVASSTAVVVQAQFAPDGQHLLATQTSPQQDDLLIYDATGGAGKSIYTDADAPPAFAPRLGAPSWSADGKSIYFMRGESLWLIGADGTNPHQLIAGSATGATQKSEATPLPSPDGQHLVWNELSFSSADNTARTALLVGDANGGNAKAIADGGVWATYSAK